MAKEKTNTQKGEISVDREHIFPIIKKWLYSEKEIFLREIVSNACDAITKINRLSSLGKYSEEGVNYKVTVTLDKESKTLTVSDNGIGMTKQEVESYICQIALSGALDFIKKYEGEDDSKNGIIGHFGLGFYSAFMVSNTVELITKSYTGEKTVGWSCNEDGEYEFITADERTEHGTDVIMHISDEEAEYLSKAKITEILNKYCGFMPYEIYFVDTEAQEHEHHHEAGEECHCHDEENKPINDTHPLWQKQPSEVTDEEYKEFYKKVFNDYRDPLFYIHINADYPLNFKGILYFPQMKTEYDSMEGQVKLYYNQVFVADNIKEVVPEFMLMLKGVLDCPELPLNVSRSYLQNSSYVSKMSAHIVKKVADKLNGNFNNEREAYEKLWDNIRMFIEYGCLRDKKFYDRVKGSLLFSLTDGKHTTVDEYLEKAKEKHEKKVYYANDGTSQAQYVSMFNAEGIDVVLFDKIIDASFIGLLEQEKEIKFIRVDADIAEALKGDGEKYENDTLVKVFKKVSENDKLNVKFESLKNADVPAILNISEESRRIDDMMKFYAANGEKGMGSFPTESTLILNSQNPIIKKLGEMEENSSEKRERLARQIYMLSLISQRQLSGEELQKFLNDSFKLLADNI